MIHQIKQERMKQKIQDKDKLKLVGKVILSIMVFFLLSMIGFYIFLISVFSKMVEVDFSTLLPEEEQILTDYMQLSYVPNSLVIDKGEYPAISGGGGDPLYNLYFSIDNKDYEEFLKRNDGIQKPINGQITIQERESKEKKRKSFCCTLSSDMANDYSKVSKLFQKYKKD